jgi:hypothetical protein
VNTNKDNVYQLDQNADMPNHDLTYYLDL